ncbi:hypothetical protein M8J77_024174 [Diaphorina citri]|nr:hypothetical protein M8J77_024174 [Diaphorina citri]
MSLKQLCHRRAVLIEKLATYVEDVSDECIDYERLLVRRQEVEAANGKFEELQDGIEEQLLKKDDVEALELESQVRRTFNRDWENLLVKLRTLISKAKTNESESSSSSHQRHQVHAGKVNFKSYDPEFETVSNFLHRLDVYLDLISCSDEHNKALVLLNSLDPRVHKDLCATILPSDPKDKSYEELSSILKNLLDGQKNIYVEQHKFISRVQSDSESVQEYCVALRNMTVNLETFSLVKNVQSKSGQHFNSEPNRGRRAGKTNVQCFRCGRKNHNSGSCFYVKSTCRSCGKVGHLAKCCKSRNDTSVHEVDNLSDHERSDTEEINCINSHDYVKIRSTDKMFVSLLVDGVPLEMELDTGAAVSSISHEDFNRHFPDKRIFKTNLKLKTYTGEVFAPKGVAYVKVKHREDVFHAKLNVIQAKVSTILGREWLREMKINWAEDVKSVEGHKEPNSLEDLLAEFQELFSDAIECIPNHQADFHMKEVVKPIFVKARSVPYALRPKVEDEIKRLEGLKIIERTEHSEWGTPVVPVLKKSGQVRLCADYKVTLNKFVMDERYPIPRIEDIFMKMKGGKVFCTLDIHQAYLHMGMTEEAAKMQTLSTHIGSFKVNRLMFGVKVAPGIWQRFMDSILFNIDGVACFFDDIIIQGATYEECFKRLRTVFETLKAHKLTLTKDKCVFFKPSISYLGHVINEHGLLKSNDKIEAIQDAPSPTNQKELKSFLGLLNYYHKFIPQLATKISPLNALLRKYQKFQWTTECEEAFQNVKKEIASDTVLVHFDSNLPVSLATDASPVGLGAVLSHRLPDGTEKPIAFASRVLTTSEKNYSQIDKEATAIYWGVKKFYDFVYGRKFTLITDHKPLVSIFNPNKMLPSVTASRLFNYAHFLSGFDYDIVYRKTGDHGNADFLSRFPTGKCKEDIDSASFFQMNQISSIPVKYEEILSHTRTDPDLSKIVNALEQGTSLKSLGYEDNQFTLEHGCLLRGQQVVIPSALRKRVLDELHTAHQGIVKMKALARSYCYWSGMDKEIERVARSCSSCSVNANENAKVEVHPWELPDGAWQRIHIDFAGPIKGQMILVIVDAYSKWTELFVTKTTTSTWVINKLRQLFTCFGLPVTLVSDNGSQFTSKEFEDFLREQGISHLTSAPYHPSSNGLAERGVQSMKQSLRKMSEDGGTLESKIQNFLIQYRRSPHSSTGVSPFEAMFGRPMRNTLTLMKKVPKNTSRNTRCVKRSFPIGTMVQYRNYQPGPKWFVGKVVKKIGQFNYLIKLRDGSTCKRHVDQMKSPDDQYWRSRLSPWLGQSRNEGGLWWPVLALQVGIMRPLLEYLAAGGRHSGSHHLHLPQHLCRQSVPRSDLLLIYLYSEPSGRLSTNHR